MIKRLLWLFLAGGLFWLGLLVSRAGFEKIEQLRKMERIPRTTIGALIPGEANIEGVARMHEGQFVKGPDSGAVCLYYYYTEEVRTTDSDGNTKWETVHSSRGFVPFLIQDETASVLARPSGPGSGTLQVRHTRREGDRRYTESRIDPGMTVFAMGLAVQEEERMALVFEGDGAFVPMISTITEEEERGLFGLSSLLLTVLSLTLLSLAMFAFTRTAGIHQTLAYLLLVALTIAGGMVYQAHIMMKSDLRAAFGRLETERATREGIIRALLAEGGLEWTGEWAELKSFLSKEAGLEPVDLQERLSEHRVNMARSMLRVERLRARAPERWVAEAEGYSALELFELVPAEEERLMEMETAFQTSRIAGMEAAIMAGVGGGLALLLGWLGMLFIRKKRWIENIPTVKTKGVVYGINELKGEVVMPPGKEALVGPLSGEPCAYYRYVIRERQRSGKNTTWVTIADERRQAPFLLRDNEGELEVRPGDAQILLKTRTRKRRGKQRHTEHRLFIGARAYALGSAVVCPETHDRLVLARGDDKRLPFMLSDYREEELIARKATSGFVLLNLGFNAFMLAAFSYAGYRGGFNAISYLAAALAPLVYWFIFMLVVHFNDLVFLRRRCDAMWANIDVALKKRFDLLPQLVATAKAYLAHEQGIQKQLAILRTSGQPLTPDEARNMIAAETSARQDIRLLAEQYPDLKGNTLMADLMRRVRNLDDEIAFMREGYNQAVEMYNTRIARIPDVLLARLFLFTKRDYLYKASSA